MAIADAEVAADGKINQPVILAQALAARAWRDRSYTNRTRVGAAKRPTFGCRTVAELTNDVHRREGLPVEADGAFRSPTGPNCTTRRTQILRVASTVKGSALDPLGPGVFRDRQCGWCLHRHWLVKVGSAGAWRGGGDCYDRSAREEGDPKSMAVATLFFHPSGEFNSTIARIEGMTLLLGCIEENTSNSESRCLWLICHTDIGLTYCKH